MLLKSHRRFRSTGFHFLSCRQNETLVIMCSAFIQSACKYAGVGEGNLFFFSVCKKREGKSSFADFGFGAGEAVCKCAFAVAVGILVQFVHQLVTI